MEQEIVNYINKLVQVHKAVLGEQLIGIYLNGSLAFEDFQPHKSDIDVLTVVRSPLTIIQKEALAKTVSYENLPVPASGLELVVTTLDQVQQPSQSPQIELQYSTSPDWPDEKPEFSGSAAELLVTFAICLQQGVAAWGKPASEVFTPIPKKWILATLIDGITWHQDKILDELHDPKGQYSVLNACRAWKFAEEGVLSSKTAGAEWVLAKYPDNQLVRHALAIRLGQDSEPLNKESIKSFLAEIINNLKKSQE